MMFDVMIGSQSNHNQKTFIANSSGKVIFLSANRDVIQSAIDVFNMNVRMTYNNSLPRFIVKSGDDISTERDTELLFYNLIFNGVNINASFIYCDDNNDELDDMESVGVSTEIIRTCEFFILGECELNETEEHIISMTIESFGYVNRSRNIKEQLYKIQ